jgi:hypothetical protein
MTCAFCHKSALPGQIGCSDHLDNFKKGDAATQRQRVKNLLNHTGRVQPKTNIDNDDEAPKPRWR